MKRLRVDRFLPHRNRKFSTLAVAEGIWDTMLFPKLSGRENIIKEKKIARTVSYSHPPDAQAPASLDGADTSDFSFEKAPSFVGSFPVRNKPKGFCLFL